MFVLPETLPPTVAELDALLDEARAEITLITAKHRKGEELSNEDVTALNTLLSAADTLTSARAEAATTEAEHSAEVDSAVTRAEQLLNPPAAEAEPEPEPDDAPADEPVVEVEDVEQQVEAVVATAGGQAFAAVGAGGEPDLPNAPGWEMDPSCPGYRSGMGRIGFSDLAKAIDSVKSGSRSRNRPNKPSAGAFAAQVLARLPRPDMPVIGDSHALVAAINEATNEANLPGGSLVAAGGWCSPSEQLYNFCDVPMASDLISLPDVLIERGGIRWPIEPDMSAIASSFEWFFTEPELEAVDSGDGTPTAFKTCVEVPCVDEFEEIRLNAVGYCVEVGILQQQGWPELVEWFLQTLAQEHLRAISKRTILDIVSGSDAKTINANTQIGTVSSILNGLSIQATNLRLDRGLPRNATIEGVAPSWLLEVMRADLAMMQGLDTKAVPDAWILGLFAARNIMLQFVGDWQTRDSGKPGNMGTLAWPTTVNVLLYPAGTWWRSLQPVIELGTMYPKEQLQVNRFTRFFTEDSIAVAKRCNKSLNVSIPLCVSGAVGARVAMACDS